MEIGRPDGILIPGLLSSVKQHALPLEQLDVQQMDDRFAGFVIPDDCIALFEAYAGYLLVEKCVLAQMRLAEQLGAQLKVGDEI